MINTRYLLAQLGARIVSETAGTLTIQVLPDMPDATVQVKASNLRSWCENRIESRKKHVGKSFRGSGGAAARKY